MAEIRYDGPIDDVRQGRHVISIGRMDTDDLTVAWDPPEGCGNPGCEDGLVTHLGQPRGGELAIDRAERDRLVREIDIRNLSNVIIPRHQAAVALAEQQQADAEAELSELAADAGLPLAVRRVAEREARRRLRDAEQAAATARATEAAESARRAELQAAP